MPHPLLHEHDWIANIMKGFSYIVSACLVTVDFASGSITFMNQNIGAVGGLLGIATFILNWVYKQKEENRKKRLEDK